MSLIIFEDVEIEIIENSKFVFTQTTNEVAKAYFGEPKTVQQAELFAKQIRQTRLNNKQEFIENKHFFYTYDNKNRKTIIWTKNGIVRLGFFIKSERAKKFRDWAEDYIVNQNQSSNHDLQKILNQIEKQNQEIRNLKKQLATKDEKEYRFKNYYDKDFVFREWQNEYAFLRKDWMQLLNECERTLFAERQNRNYTRQLSYQKE
ncbi:hypothetical protein AAX26_01777 [Aliarcobacter thereius]|uniref:hypothetical protein n=1 Tax=Aliarcobacter thereius TaxID=544718 RepID=UPI000828FC1D|nr:hypothetical protein [Aliarcobacter thereius]OCL85710.1 hypothetical protein AAX26_01777 [Aliarcobacter thereius]